MEWLSALAIVTIVAGVTLTTVVLFAVRALRRTLNDGALRQAHQIKRLTDAVATLNQQQQSAQTRIQALGEANRRMSDELAALYERMGEGELPTRASGAPRLLN
jgi:DNA anti-recombination protein RmuC